MNEQTWVGPWDDEVMVDLDAQGNVLDVYAYNDGPLIEQTEGRLQWTVGKNPLFLHAFDPELAVRIMREEFQYIEPHEA